MTTGFEDVREARLALSSHRDRLIALRDALAKPETEAAYRELDAMVEHVSSILHLLTN